MRKTAIKFYIFFLLGITSAWANHTQISSFREIADELKNSPDQTLIVFDVDEVLITTEEEVINLYDSEILAPMVQEIMAEAKTPEEARRLFEEICSLVTLGAKTILIESEIPQLITELKNQGLKVLALTHCSTGPFGLIPQIERWRIDHLHSLGIDFASFFPLIPCQPLDEMGFESPLPLFEEGILFTNLYEKGDVLAAFLIQNNFYPSKVIFIDDRIDNLDSVQAALKLLNIEFKGYHYLGAQRISKQMATKEVLCMQLAHMIKNREWLSIQEVKTLLETKASEVGSF